MLSDKKKPQLLRLLKRFLLIGRVNSKTYQTPLEHKFQKLLTYLKNEKISIKKILNCVHRHVFKRNGKGGGDVCEILNHIMLFALNFAFSI